MRSWFPGETYVRISTAAISPDGRLPAVLATAGEKSALEAIIGSQPGPVRELVSPVRTRTGTVREERT